MKPATNRDALIAVLHNLLSNAIKYNVMGGSVTCSFDKEGDHVVLRLANTRLAVARTPCSSSP